MGSRWQCLTDDPDLNDRSLSAPASADLPGVALVWLVAGLVAVFAAVVLLPGWTTFDSAFQLWQARTGVYNNQHPLFVTMAWGIADRVAGAPGGPLMVAILCAVTGLALLGSTSVHRSRIVLPVVLLWPPLLVLWGHLWSNVLLASLLMLALGLVERARIHPGRIAVALAYVAIFAAVLTRYEAIPAVIPLLWRLHQGQVALRRVFLCIGVAVAGVVVQSLLVRTLVTEPVPTWSPSALWDLAAISVSERELLIPACMHGKGMTVEELDDLVIAHTAGPLVLQAPSGINVGMVTPWPVECRDEVLRTWLTMVAVHPWDWLGHRLRIVKSLLGRQGGDKPRELVIAPGSTGYRNLAAHPVSERAVNRVLISAIDRFRGTAFLAPVTYLLLALAATVASRRARWPSSGMIETLTLSGMLSLATIVAISPSADWRHATWAMFAFLVATVLALQDVFGSRQGPG